METVNNLPDSGNTTYLIDASIYIFRAWFGIPDHFFDDSGRSVNALFGYNQFLRKFLAAARPKNVVAAFDESLETGFRHQLYEDYKANRALPDEALAYQLECCKAVTEQWGVSTIASDIYEADDIIATVARKRRKKGEAIVVLSSDKDLAQIIGPSDYLWDFHKDRLRDSESLSRDWQFPPERVADYLALVGDSIDNIPGVPGLGDKSGKALMAHFESVEDLYSRICEVEALPIRGTKALMQRLVEHEEDVRLYKMLTLLHDKVKCSASDKATRIKKTSSESRDDWLAGRGLSSLINLHL